jgi:benzylsuccinate CoA-transferase BbsE subunit
VTALAGIRVLDLSGPLGNYCGKLFAGLGADVVLLEPPAGTGLRYEPPFDRHGQSLAFAYANGGKRSAILDLDTDPEALLHLAEHADLILETEPPGMMARRRLAFGDLCQVNPRLVLTSITPFGQTGPYAGRDGDDLIASALGGMLYLGGYPDTEPIRPAGEQAVAAANLFAAVGAMLALTWAELTGEGQHVDVSMMEAVVMGLENSPQFYDLENVIRRRNGGVRRLAGTGTFACADGYVCLLATGFGGTQHWTKLIAWLEQALGTPLPALHGERWADPGFLVADAAKAVFAELFEPFCAERSTAELYQDAQRWRVPLCPVNAPSGVLKDAQLLARSAFIDLGDGVLAPGAPYRLSATPWRIDRPAPALGEHHHEIFG